MVLRVRRERLFYNTFKSITIRYYLQLVDYQCNVHKRAYLHLGQKLAKNWPKSLSIENQQVIKISFQLLPGRKFKNTETGFCAIFVRKLLTQNISGIKTRIAEKPFRTQIK